MPRTSDELEVVIEVDDRAAQRRTKDFNRSVEDTGKTAERASRRVTRAKTVEEQALERNLKLQKQAERQIAAAEKRAQTFGLKGVARLQAQRKALLDTAKAAGKGDAEIQRINKSFDTMEKRTAKSTKSFSLLNKGVVVAAAGLAALAAITKKVIVDSALLSARNETLAVAMASVARNTGTSIGLLRRQEDALRSLGLTTQATRTILARLTATGLPVERVQELVDTARNLAVVMGTNTSEAAIRLTRAIISQEVEILRTAGLNVKFEDGHKKLAEQLGKTAAALTKEEKQLANFNIVVDQNKNLIGLYNDALETTGKKLSSLPRLFENVGESIGLRFQPILDRATESLSNFLKGADEALRFDTEVGAAEERRRARGDTLLGPSQVPSFFDRITGLITGLNVNEDTLREIFAQRQRQTQADIGADARLRLGITGEGSAKFGPPEQTFGTTLKSKLQRDIDKNLAEASEQNAAAIAKAATASDKLRVEYEKTRRVVSLARPEVGGGLFRAFGIKPTLGTATGGTVTLGRPELGGGDVGFQIQGRSADITSQLARQQRVAQDQARIVADHNQRVFDSLKRSAEGVFDELLLSSRGFFDAMGNIMKTAMLTAVKELVTSRIALMLPGLFGGSGSPGGGGGFGSLASLAGLGGISRAGTPGGTPGILPGPVGGALVGRSTLGAGSLAGFGGLGGGFGGLGGLFRGGRGSDVVGLHAGGGLGGALQSTGGALVGAGLLTAGLRRGGLSGIGLSAAGGALIGAKFGGPLGAVIGGIAGAGAGLIRTLFGSATDKARDKIKATYGIDIKNKDVLTQIVQMAKQNYAGSLDMAIRADPVRELIELYAMSTGQNALGINPRVTPVSLSQSAGVIRQQAQFRNGSPFVVQSSLPTVGTLSARQNVTVLQLDGRQTKALYQGEAVEVIRDQPRLVQQSAGQAVRQSFGRRQTAGDLLQPGTVFA